MRRRQGRPATKGVCVICGTEVDKIRGLPLRSMTCPKCNKQTIVRK